MATAKESKPRQSRQRFWGDWTFPGQVTLLLFMAVTAAWSQQAEQGIDSGNYNIKQSVEFGYRFTDVTGNQATYDTFVNLQQGPRLLDMTLEMRSLDHHGLLFDRLYHEQLWVWRRSQQRLSSAHRQEQVVRLRRNISPRPECLGLLVAGQPAEPGQHIYRRTAGLQSHYQILAAPVQHPAANGRLQPDAVAAIENPLPAWLLAQRE